VVERQEGGTQHTTTGVHHGGGGRTISGDPNTGTLGAGQHPNSEGCYGSGGGSHGATCRISINEEGVPHKDIRGTLHYKESR
jgi:hypothetical protein